MTVSTDELKQHLAIEGDEDDAMLTAIIGEAMSWIENYTGLESLPVEETPPALNRAVKTLAAHFYQQRGDSFEPLSIPADVFGLCAPYKEFAF
ncbi:head-tail connector protein [Aureimonas altamirensis]|uniref:head-tail connector protein n=1 Tax=Aureimonas altamirensis TaxID=370622 RepID=UPI00203693D8|nr:head-tail connector protein [Aureimonas altamirensis]MCM2504096.1 head-tail connector protein [Aureimonas altamirensis]